MYIKLLRKPEGKNSSNSEPTILGRYPCVSLVEYFLRTRRCSEYYLNSLLFQRYNSETILVCIIMTEQMSKQIYWCWEPGDSQCGKGSRKRIREGTRWTLWCWTGIWVTSMNPGFKKPTHLFHSSTYWTNLEAMVPRIVNTPSLSRFWLLIAHLHYNEPLLLREVPGLRWAWGVPADHPPPGSTETWMEMPQKDMALGWKAAITHIWDNW